MNLLRPGEDTNQIFNFCLADAAKRFAIDLIAWSTMSNHYHSVIYDRFGRVSQFLEHAHKMMAKCLNVHWVRWENFWSTEETCVTYLPTPEDVFDKVLYTLSNPLNAHLVDRLVDWPGCTALHHLDGRTTICERPKQFFSDKGKMPETVELRASRPCFLESTEAYEQWVSRLRAELACIENERRAERMETKRSVVGRKELMRASPTSSPDTTAPRRRLRPRVACKDRTIREAFLEELKEFWAARALARVSKVAVAFFASLPIGSIGRIDLATS